MQDKASRAAPPPSSSPAVAGQEHQNHAHLTGVTQHHCQVLTLLSVPSWDGPDSFPALGEQSGGQRGPMGRTTVPRSLRALQPLLAQQRVLVATDGTAGKVQSGGRERFLVLQVRHLIPAAGGGLGVSPRLGEHLQWGPRVLLKDLDLLRSWFCYKTGSLLVKLPVS